MSRISVVWQYADQHLDLDLGANPTVGVSRLHKAKKEHQPWSDGVLAAFDAAAPGHLRLGVMLLLYTGQRRSDVVQMRWSQFDGDTIEVVQQKTGEPVTIPCHKRLRATLSTLPRQSEFILTGERGAPYKAASLAAMVRKQLLLSAFTAIRSTDSGRTPRWRFLKLVALFLRSWLSPDIARLLWRCITASVPKRSALLARQLTSGKLPKCLT
jgi:integrase